MSAPVRPALTAEKWASILNDNGLYTELAGYEVCLHPYGQGRVEVVDTDGWYYSHKLNFFPGDMKSMAALFLHNQPFGFTREDVERLHCSANTIESADCRAGFKRFFGNADFLDEHAEALRSLAGRIEALLPPEGDVTMYVTEKPKTMCVECRWYRLRWFRGNCCRNPAAVCDGGFQSIPYLLPRCRDINYGNCPYYEVRRK